MSTEDRRDRHADEVLALERAVSTRAVVRLAAEVAAALATWMGAARTQLLTGAAPPGGLRGLLARLLLNIRPSLRPELEAGVERAMSLGIRQGQEALEELGTPPVGITRPPSDPELEGVLSAADPAAVRRLADAVRLAEQLGLDDLENVSSVVARAHQAVTAAEGTSAWAVNRAVSAGTAAVAQLAGMNVVWIAERNACLNCLAYSGQVVEPGRPFPPGLTFGDRPLKPLGPLLYPPLHPNCRCQLDITNLEPGQDDSLVREAQRTVARGWSEYASEPARRRAADALIRRGSLLPRSVLARAARDIASGSFSQRHRPRTNLQA